MFICSTKFLHQRMKQMFQHGGHKVHYFQVPWHFTLQIERHSSPWFLMSEVMMMMLTDVSAVTNDVRVVWATLTDWLWHSDGPMVGSKLSRAGLSRARRPEPESSWTGSGVAGHGAWPGWAGRAGIDKSKTLITTGYSASPVNMGLIWGSAGPTMGRPLLVLLGHHKQRHVQSQKLTLVMS